MADFIPAGGGEGAYFFAGGGGTGAGYYYAVAGKGCTTVADSGYGNTACYWSTSKTLKVRGWVGCNPGTAGYYVRLYNNTAGVAIYAVSLSKPSQQWAYSDTPLTTYTLPANDLLDMNNDAYAYAAFWGEVI